MASTPTLILIAGPTAVGKTAVAIEVAKHFGTEIISADSRQCFQELRIGVARPSEEELAAVPHHFIASHSIHQKVTAATFEEYALQKAANIFTRSSTVVAVGGTGLYIKVFLEGMDEIPEVPQAVHDEVAAGYAQHGTAWLHQQIRSADPLYWQRGEIQNPQRTMRALEVARATGRSILSFQQGAKTPRPFNVVKIGLTLPKEALHNRIARRVDAMMQEGLLQEVQLLQPYGGLNALQTVGYKELFAALKGGASIDEAVEQIKVHTRQYAKRQMTWFKKDPDYAWLPPDAEAVIRQLRERLRLA